MKKTFILSLLIFTFLSCNRDNIVFTETGEEIQILKFDSNESLEKELERVIALKNQKEASIISKMFGEAGLQTPADINVKLNIQNTDKQNLLASANLYHEERLKAVYEERDERNFTSIQSIADELNSLKLLKPAKYDELYNEYSNFLVKSEYEISTKFDKNTSNLINTEGILILQSEKVSFAHEEIESKTAKNNSKANYQEGIITTGYNGFVAITYNKLFVNGYIPPANSTTRGIYTAQMAAGVHCLVKAGTTYVNYPCIFQFDSRSKASALIVPCGVNPYSIKFSSGTGISRYVNRETATYNCSSFNSAVRLTVGGKYLVPIAGTSNFLTVEKGLANY